jgi:cinnamyl-alcohol dehydrogenase
LHFIIDTAAGNHPFDPYLSLLKAGGTLTLVGFPSEINMHPGSLIFGIATYSITKFRHSIIYWCKELLKKNYLAQIHIYTGARTLSGSGGGGTKGIQEMLNFCAANKIYPEVEVIKMDYINKALERLVNRDVKYRFVIDIENSQN